MTYDYCWTYPIAYLKKAIGDLDTAIKALDTRVTALETAAESAGDAKTVETKGGKK